MEVYQSKILIEGLSFPESPRWHEGNFWFTDQHAKRVYRLHLDGKLETIIETEDLPGGLGWLPDGSLLVVYMTRRQIMKWNGSELELYADLSRHASFHCNDMVIDEEGRIYAGNFGFDLHGGDEQTSAELLLIDKNRLISVESSEVVFPNGSVITPDKKHLIVAETFAHRLTDFKLDGYGKIKSSRTWAELGDVTPDGICLDDAGMIWVASPGTHEVIRVKHGGSKVSFCNTRGTPYACMLGGEARKTLYICTSETDDPEKAIQLKSGRIEAVDVDAKGAGLP